MESYGIQQFEEWKTRGILAEYHVLFSRYVDTDNWDMLALLRFRSYEDVGKWREVEKRSPAGLSPNLLEWVTSVETYPADLARGKEAGSGRERPVYLVVPYTYSVTPSAYLEYADNFVRPQLEGWARAGVLSGYGLYLQRYSANRPWDSLLVLEYKDDAAFGLREKTVAKVRQELQSDPAWRSLSDSKHNIRVEKEAVIADELAPGR